VPQDVAVIGIDDTEMGRFFVPSLTTIRQDRHRMVSAAIDLLVKMIETKELISKQVVLETELVVRESA
jgi:DNA-binding LacI/PurR family transcriptional regulator